jgi:hypothetical protein
MLEWVPTGRLVLKPRTAVVLKKAQVTSLFMQDACYS